MAPAKVVVSSAEHDLIKNVAKYFLELLNTMATTVTVGVSGK